LERVRLPVEHLCHIKRMLIEIKLIIVCLRHMCPNRHSFDSYFTSCNSFLQYALRIKPSETNLNCIAKLKFFILNGNSFYYRSVFYSNRWHLWFKRIQSCRLCILCARLSRNDFIFWIQSVANPYEAARLVYFLKLILSIAKKLSRSVQYFQKFRLIRL
jgi:hypothetical protein